MFFKNEKCGHCVEKFQKRNFEAYARFGTEACCNTKCD
jgi:hypothetical protein